MRELVKKLEEKGFDELLERLDAGMPDLYTELEKAVERRRPLQ